VEWLRRSFEAPGGRRARAGASRHDQGSEFTGGASLRAGHWRSFGVQVNRKERRLAPRVSLDSCAARSCGGHRRHGADRALDEERAGAARRLAARVCRFLIVAQPEEEALIKSFRNLPRTLVIPPTRSEVAALIWARSLLVSEASLPLVQAKAAARKEESK